MFLVMMTMTSLSAGELVAASPREVEAALGQIGADKELGAHLSGLAKEQLAEAPVLGLSDGLWLMPLDLGAFLEDRTVAAALDRELAQGGLYLPNDLEFGFGMAFVPGDIARELGALDDLGQYADLGEDMLEQSATDIIWWVIGGLAAGTIYVGYEIYEMTYKEAYQEGFNEANLTMSETHDSDGDGKTNYHDPDDDNDGTNDKEDHYPFDNTRKICDLCGGGSIPGLMDTSDTFFFTEGLDSELTTELAVDAILNFVDSQGSAGLVLSL